jgi:hypothetical protein
MVAALTLASCRGHRELCEREECAPGLTNAQGGASDEQPSSGAAAPVGQGGQRPPECTVDADCDDARRCNGVETCLVERCSAGKDVECGNGTVCNEAAVELCVYEQPSPWVIATSFESLLGLPLDELEKGGEMVELARRERDELLTGFDHVWWSPNGRVAVVRSFEDRMGSRMHLMRFGAGLPSKLESIPEVPNWGNFWEAPVFTADSARVMIVDNYSGTYVVDLTDPAAPTTTLGSDTPDTEGTLGVVALCRDSDTWVAVDDDYSYFLATASDGQVSTVALGDGNVTVSPDGRLIAIDVEGEEGDSSLELRPCSADTWVAPLGAGYRLEFSPDSRLIAVELTEYDGGMSVASLADPQHPSTIWSDAAASPPLGPWFTPDSGRLMAELSDTTEEDPTVHVLNLSSGEIKPLGLGPYARVVEVGEQALLAWSVDFAAEPRDLVWQAFDRDAAPLVIVSDSDRQETSLERVRFDPASVFVSRMVGEDTEFGTLRFDASKPTLAAPFVFPGLLSRIEPAPDRRAVLLLMQKGLIDGKLFWISYSESGEASEPRMLPGNPLFLSIQP